MLTEVLDMLGTEVKAVADGGGLLVCVASQYDEGHTPGEVDLIVTDVAMPVCSGFDILGAIRSAGWRTPVIIITGIVTDNVRARAVKLGATLLPKPIDLATFQSTVVDLLLAGPPESAQISSGRCPSSRHGKKSGPPP